MNHEESGGSVSGQKRLKSTSSEIAQEVCYWLFESAEENAERIANHDLQDPSNGSDDFRGSMVREIYYTAEEEIEAVLSQNGLNQYQEVVEQVCVLELSERFDDLISRFSDTDKPGPVEMAIEEAAKPFKAWLADVLLEKLAELEGIAEQQRQADERERLRSQKRSRRWLSAVKDFFSR